jgi:hypothetical protein
MRTTHGHWADNSTRFADLGAGVSHRQAEGAFVYPEHDKDDMVNPVGLGRVLLGFIALLLGVVLAVKYLITGSIL